MKKQIITGIVIIVCAALRAAVCPWGAEVEEFTRWAGGRAERYFRTAEQTIIIHYRDIGVVGAFAEEAEKIAEQRQRQTA